MSDITPFDLEGEDENTAETHGRRFPLRRYRRTNRACS